MSLLSRLAVQAARAYGILSSKSTNVSASYLVVAGGAGGQQGGGGAGGLLTSTFTLSTLTTYTVTVGAGGPNAGATNVRGGSNSSVSGTGLSTVTATGGGYGGGGSYQAGAGGSGGGGSNDAPRTGGTGTVGQGNDGGAGSATFGGGGGGAGAAGSSQNAGNGSASSISGSSVTYAGGGGGGSSGTPGTGGTGGGGAGSNATAAGSGTVNTGGGGGGTWASTTGAGGSGVVIISYASATPKFVGGTLTTSGGNQIHTFTSSGTLSPITPITASYLVVAGGGGGGTASSGFYAGGGGAGGLLTSSTTLYSGATYVVTVGAGGAINTSGSSSVLLGTGLTTVTSTGGGRGGAFQTNGAAGGSGGGAGGDGSGGTYTGGLGTSGQGNNGGNAALAFGSTNTGGGGGGGAGAAGSNSPTSTKNGGAGGAGSASSISGTSVTYSAGGGGMAGNDGTGGTEGANGTGWVSAPNLGHGGGPSVQRAGSSGVVIISYAGSQAFNGGLVTSSGGNTIHTFTSSGALTPLTNNLTNSLRFRASASAYLSRTFVSTGTNNKIQTFSAWVKRGLLSSSTDYRLMGGYDGSSANSTEINFNNDSLRLEFGGAANNPVITTQVFRDPSAWYHIVIAIDTTQATAANRVKMYVNGNQITAFSTATYPAQNALSQLTSANINNRIGSSWSGSNPFDGYMTDINFIDGQALEPYYFGNNDAYGNWKPILYKGMYGTNGFYLTFADTSAATAAAIGKDSSPNGNNWTPNNISVTAGTTYDAMLDVPTNTSATVANYCVNNPIDTSPTGGTNAITISGANLNLAGASTDWAACRATIGVTSGKWYWECTRTGASNLIFGIGLNSTTLVNAYSSTSYGYFSTGDKYSNNVSSAYGASFTSGDVIGVAFDADAGTLTFYKNNTSQGTAFTGLTSGPYFPLNQLYTTGSTASINFGQRPFSYTPPSGFVALNTFNLPTPTILQGNKYMDATLYTGNGSTQVVVNNAQFKPDFVWIKCRSGIQDNTLFDSVRGTTKYIISNSTIAEVTDATTLTAFNSNGWTMGLFNQINNNASTYVGWQWQAGQGSTSSNTSGSITSTVSVNTTAGFSVVTYTGTGANATVGHGLGVAPSMIIVKNRTTAATSWAVYHTSLGNTNYLLLETTNASASSITAWNNTSPTSTVFSVGTGTSVNQNTNSMLAYCWAEIAGFSKFGSYTGNGSADGPFVYTGFRPKWLLVKQSSSAGNAWQLLDSSRNTYNKADNALFPNTTGAETTGNATFDFLANGFKVRTTDGTVNTSSSTYIYAAYAENPFKNSNAR